MAIIVRRRRRKLTRTDCILLGIVTVFITAMLTYAGISEYIQGTINIAGPIVLPLVSIPWPIFFFSKAKSLREAEEKRRKDYQEHQAALAEAAKRRQEQEQKAAQALQERQKEQARLQMDAKLQAAYLHETRLLAKVPIVISSPAGEYTATEDFVIFWFEGKVCCAPAAQFRGQLLGKFEFRNRMWRFTNLAPESVKTELGSNPPMAPNETCNVIPFPLELLYHTSPRINAITSIRAGWK